MIKGVVRGGILVIGLDGENMTRLMAGEPMLFDLADFGLPPRPVVILGGRTLDDVRGQINTALSAAANAFTCPKCERTSYHPEDKRNGYCGHCHQFTGTITQQPGQTTGHAGGHSTPGG